MSKIKLTIVVKEELDSVVIENLCHALLAQTEDIPAQFVVELEVDDQKI